MSRIVTVVVVVVALMSLCVAAHGPFHHRGRHGEGRHGRMGSIEGFGRGYGHTGGAGASAQLSVGLVRPLDDGGVLVEAFELSLRGSALSSLRAMALGQILPGLATTEQANELSDWPQNLQVSDCDSLASARDQASCLTELIRRMEEDVNRKIEILIDTDVGQQAQIAGLWVVILLLVLLGTCGMCLKMLRRRHRRNTYRRIQKKLNKLEQITRSSDDEHVVPHHASTNELDYSLSYNLPTPPTFAVPPAPQVLFQPIQVMPQYFPLPSQEE